MLGILSTVEVVGFKKGVRLKPAAAQERLNIKIGVDVSVFFFKMNGNKLKRRRRRRRRRHRHQRCRRRRRGRAFFDRLEDWSKTLLNQFSKNSICS